MSDNWIYTKDKIPEKDDYYLVCSKFGVFNILHWSDGWNCFNKDKKYEIKDVVAWMELPSPPER